MKTKGDCGSASNLGKILLTHMDIYGYVGKIQTGDKERRSAHQ